MPGLDTPPTSGDDTSDSSDSSVDDSSDDSDSDEHEPAEEKEADDVIDIDAIDVDAIDDDAIDDDAIVVEHVDEQDESSDGDDEDSECTEEIDAPVAAIRPRPRRSTRGNPDYVGEHVDQHFNDGRSGYTHFGRTRRGGDVRPAAGEQPKLPKVYRNSVTIHNFFCAPGKICLLVQCWSRTYVTIMRMCVQVKHVLRCLRKGPRLNGNNR